VIAIDNHLPDVPQLPLHCFAWMRKPPGESMRPPAQALQTLLETLRLSRSHGLTLATHGRSYKSQLQGSDRMGMITNSKARR
jgi:hypothetical protein